MRFFDFAPAVNLADVLIYQLQTAFNFISGYMMTYTGDYKWGLIFGFTAWTIGLGLISTFNKDTSLAKLVGYQIIAGAGAGEHAFPALLCPSLSQS